jgi:hypothetical protein
MKKNYVVYINGDQNQIGYVKAVSNNEATKKAKIKYPGQMVSVVYYTRA